MKLFNEKRVSIANDSTDKHKYENRVSARMQSIAKPVDSALITCFNAFLLILSVSHCFWLKDLRHRNGGMKCWFSWVSTGTGSALALPMALPLSPEKNRKMFEIHWKPNWINSCIKRNTKYELYSQLCKNPSFFYSPLSILRVRALALLHSQCSLSGKLSLSLL